MTYEDLFVAVDAAAPELENCALRLLLRLIAIAIQQGSNQVRVSDRWIMSSLGLSKGGVTAAKHGIEKFVTVVPSPGTVTLFDLPADWFGSQPSLFYSTGALLNRAPRPTDQGASALMNGAPVPYSIGHGALMNRADCPTEQGKCPTEQGAAPYSIGQSALFKRAPAIENQQDSDGSSTRLDSTQKLTTTEQLHRLDRIFHTTQIPEPKLADALRLRLALHQFMQQCGTARAADQPPKEEILAKCLAIAAVDELLIALRDVANSRKCNPNAYIWFVVVFLDQINGIPWKTTAAYMKEQKQRKPAQRQAAAPFHHQLVAQAANQVKRLR